MCPIDSVCIYVYWFCFSWEPWHHGHGAPGLRALPPLISQPPFIPPPLTLSPTTVAFSHPFLILHPFSSSSCPLLPQALVSVWAIVTLPFPWLTPIFLPQSLAQSTTASSGIFPLSNSLSKLKALHIPPGSWVKLPPQSSWYISPM